MAADNGQDRVGRPSGRMVLVLLALAGVVGVVVSLAAWGYLEGVHQVEDAVFTDLPRELGYDNGAPLWWSLPVLGLAGLVIAFAIVRLPGSGGHVPADGLNAGQTQPIELPGVVLASLATLGLGLVLGPEAPLIALGSGLGILAVRLVKQDAPDEVVAVVAAAGSFAAISFIFGSALIGAVILIEAAGLDRRRMTMVLLPGLLAAGLGSLVSVGMGSWTGLSSSDWALGALSLPQFGRPDFAEFAWTIPFAAAVAVVSFAIFRVARELHPRLMRHPFLLLPAAGLVVSGLAIAFSQTTDKGVDQVLFSGETQLPQLVDNAGTWSLGALALLIVFKGLAWSISLAGFRGGPTFPGMFLGAAAGLMASHLPGLSTTPAVAVGIGATVAAVLRLPLAAVVLASVLTAKSGGAGAEPLIIVGVVVAMLTTMALSGPEPPEEPDGDGPDRAAARTPVAAADGAPVAASGPG